MTSGAGLKRWSWLTAVVLVLGMSACSSDDDSGGNGGTDATVDRGSDVDRDVPTSDTPPQDTSVDIPVADQTTDQGGELCEQIGAAENVGSSCDVNATDPQCGQGGVCADLGTGGAVCWQVCIPQMCEDLCTGAGEQCLNVVDENGVPIEIQPGVNLGVCAVPPAGTQGPYDPCGTAATGACEQGLQCISLTGIDGALPMCVPECGTGGTCPDRESVAGQCALGAGGDPTHCALVCDPSGSATCPTGMDCFAVTGGGICLWPES